MSTIADSPAWKALRSHARDSERKHLRDLLGDRARCAAMTAEHDGIYLDFSRQNADRETLGLLLDLAASAGLTGKLRAMAAGERINRSEDR
nr:glucose-6-phosphate isomerase [Planctomycetota bacterium]